VRVRFSRTAVDRRWRHGGGQSDLYYGGYTDRDRRSVGGVCARLGRAVCTRRGCYPLAVATRVGANRKAPDIGTTAHMLMVGEAGPIWITAVIQLGTADRSAA
jgi:hypothetical protein